jgi:hypothetical protein
MHQGHRVLSQIMAKLEAAHCRVERHGERLRAQIPSIDSALTSSLPANGAITSFLELFQDRVEIELHDDGAPKFKHLYGSVPQLAIHALITSAFAFEFFWGGRLETWAQFLLITSFANLIPWLAASVQTHLFLNRHLVDRA